MSEYECPRCHGGFPVRGLAEGGSCPWCGLEVDGEFDEYGPTVRTVSRDDNGDSETNGGLIERMFA